MKYLIVYLLIGILITTIAIKSIFDNEGSRSRISKNFERSASSVIAAFAITSLFWPIILLYAFCSVWEDK